MTESDFDQRVSDSTTTTTTTGTVGDDGVVDTTDNGSKDDVSKDHGSKDDGSKDHGSKDKGSKDHGSKDDGSKDDGSKDDGSKDHGSKDKGSKDHGSKDDGSKDSGSKDHGSKDTSSDGSSDFLYGSSSDEDIFEIAADAGTTYIDNFDMSADTLDLSQVITDEAVTEESLSDYLDYSNVDGDVQKDDTELTVDADGDSKTTDDQTTIYIQDSTLNENDLDDMNIDFQND
jgi:hypothetical protein